MKLIDADKLIEFIDTFLSKTCKRDGTTIPNRWYGALKRCVEEQPTIKKGEWIPVTERLPEDRREVLVTAYWHETYQVMMASYYGDGLWWCVPFNNCGEHMQRLNPKAWMPLPEPYKAESEE